MAWPFSMGQRHTTSGYGTPLLPVMVLPVGRQVEAAHNAYSPSQMSRPLAVAVPDIKNAIISNSCFMFIFLGMVVSQGRVCRRILW